MAVLIIALVIIVVYVGWKGWSAYNRAHQDTVRMRRGEFKLADVTVGPDFIFRPGQGSHPVVGVTATVESIGQLQRRITATRLATLGVFALALQKREDDREVYVTVSGPDFDWLVTVPPEENTAARQFAAAVNQAGKRSAA